jgi:hypothetical protein
MKSLLLYYFIKKHKNYKDIIFFIFFIETCFLYHDKFYINKKHALLKKKKHVFIKTKLKKINEYRKWSFASRNVFFL